MQFERPDWRPLLAFAPAHRDDFMWMGEVTLEDGTGLHVYKHYWTRRSIHLAGDGRAFYCVWGGDSYQQIDPAHLLQEVLMPWAEPPPYDIVRRNLWRGRTHFRWGRSAAKHRVSRERIQYLIEHCDFLFASFEEGELQAVGQRLLFVGDDADAIPLEVIAVELETEELLVIHAMRLRDRYRGLYNEVIEWQR